MTDNGLCALDLSEPAVTTPTDASSPNSAPAAAQPANGSPAASNSAHPSWQVVVGAVVGSLAVLVLLLLLCAYRRRRLRRQQFAQPARSSSSNFSRPSSLQGAKRAYISTPGIWKRTGRDGSRWTSGAADSTDSLSPGLNMAHNNRRVSDLTSSGDDLWLRMHDEAPIFATGKRLSAVSRNHRPSQSSMASSSRAGALSPTLARDAISALAQRRQSKRPLSFELDDLAVNGALADELQHLAALRQRDDSQSTFHGDSGSDAISVDLAPNEPFGPHHRPSTPATTLPHPQPTYNAQPAAAMVDSAQSSVEDISLQDLPVPRPSAATTVRPISRNSDMLEKSIQAFQARPTLESTVQLPHHTYQTLPLSLNEHVSANIRKLSTADPPATLSTAQHAAPAVSAAVATADKDEPGPASHTPAITPGEARLISAQFHQRLTRPVSKSLSISSKASSGSPSSPFALNDGNPFDAKRESGDVSIDDMLGNLKRLPSSRRVSSTSPLSPPLATASARPSTRPLAASPTRIDFAQNSREAGTVAKEAVKERRIPSTILGRLPVVDDDASSTASSDSRS
ncbi:hypothetical protein RI367_003878 [Sorochytrium milnesiophthora]